MKKDLIFFLKNVKAEVSETSVIENKPSNPINLQTPTDLPETKPEEEEETLLNSKWSNSIFKFIDICEYVSRFDSAMQIVFTQNGMDIEGIDHYHMVKILIHLDRRDFTKYLFKQDTQKIFINFAELAKKFKRFTRQEDEISIILNLTELIYFKCRKIYFCQKPIEMNFDTIPTPKLEFKVTCATNLSDLIEVLEFAGDHTDYIFLKAENGLRIEGKCKDDETEFHKILKITDVHIKEPVCSQYNIKYLLDILKIARTKTLDRLGAILEFSDEFPLHITMNISPYSFFQAYLACHVKEVEG